MPKTGATQIETWRGKTWQRYVSDRRVWWNCTNEDGVNTDRMIAYRVAELKKDLIMALGTAESCQEELAFIERNWGILV